MTQIVNIKELITTKVLSTKLKVDELDRFTALANRQGESKAGLLKSLVLDYMNKGGKIGGVESINRSHPAAASKEDPPLAKPNHSHDLPCRTSPSLRKSLLNEDLPSKDLISIPGRGSADSPNPASVVNTLPGTANESHRFNSPSSLKESLPVYRNEIQGRPEAITKSSIGKGWLLSMVLLALWIKSHTSITADHNSRFITWNDI